MGQELAVTLTSGRWCRAVDFTYRRLCRQRRRVL